MIRRCSLWFANTFRTKWRSLKISRTLSTRRRVSPFLITGDRITGHNREPMRKVRNAIAGFMSATHPYRAAFWVVMIPVCVHFGWHVSLFVLFLYSTYSNFASDIAAWEASDD